MANGKRVPNDRRVWQFLLFRCFSKGSAWPVECGSEWTEVSVNLGFFCLRFVGKLLFAKRISESHQVFGVPRCEAFGLKRTQSHENQMRNSDPLAVAFGGISKSLFFFSKNKKSALDRPQ